MRVRLKTVVLALAAVAGGAISSAVIVLYSGFYNISALHQHLAPTFALLQIGLRESIERQARSVAVPPLDDPALARRGLVLYDAHCAQCHGAPGIAPAPFALGLTPLPANLAAAARERSPAELYWVVKNGIKMTGMPAWQFRFPERDLWAVVAFVRELPFIAPEDYRPRLRAARDPASAGPSASFHYAPDAARGKVALQQYACTTCHHIPGVTGNSATVGPPLDRIGTRKYIAGVLRNTPDNMVRWLRTPQAVNPRSAMPDLGVTPADARDIAAYLHTLD